MILAVLALLGLPFGLLQENQDQDAIDRWIQDLGSEDVRTRERAMEEIRKLGDAAIPHLKRAARSRDAERSITARQLLLELGKRDPGHARPDVTVVYHDWTQGVHFRRHADGRVELTVPKKDEKTGRREFKTYRADSVEAFKTKYPEVAKLHDPEALLKLPSLTPEQMKAWQALREWLGLRPDRASRRDWPSEDDFESYEDLEKWIAEQERRLEELTERWHERARGDRRPERKSPSLGILISPVDPALKAQLGLGESEGLLVQKVESGSLAEKSGLKRFDVLVTLEGKPIRDVPEFRRGLEEALTSKEFTLELIREGKRMPVKIRPEKGTEKPGSR